MVIQVQNEQNDRENNGAETLANDSHSWLVFRIYVNSLECTTMKIGDGDGVTVIC